MCKINYMLYKYISDKYNSIPNFADTSGIPLTELSAVLLKENIVTDIVAGIKICLFLELDIDRLVLDGEIAEAEVGLGGYAECGRYDSSGSSESSGSSDDYGGPLAGEFRERYMRLSAAEQRRVFEFMDSV